MSGTTAEHRPSGRPQPVVFCLSQLTSDPAIVPLLPSAGGGKADAGISKGEQCTLHPEPLRLYSRASCQRDDHMRIGIHFAIFAAGIGLVLAGVPPARQHRIGPADIYPDPVRTPGAANPESPRKTSGTTSATANGARSKSGRQRNTRAS